jgi:hypothetical protein
MTRLTVAVLLLPLAAFAGVEDELAAAAKSPYDIARFVDSHVTFDWAPLWKALGIHEDKHFMLPCGAMDGKRDCRAELITVLDPFQVIVLLDREGHYPHVYLRFRRETGPDKPGPWKFAGYYRATSRYAEPHHKTIRIGTRPFLIVGEEVYAGFDWLIRVETWLDLTLPAFDPVFRFTTQRTHNGMPDPVVRFETLGVVTEIESTPVERIHIAYSTQFTGPKIAAMRWDSAVYTRRGNEFVFDEALSRTPEHDINAWYGFDLGPSNDEALTYLFADLKKIATGEEGEDRDWLLRLLNRSSDTPEKRALNELLAAPAKPK